MRIIKYINIVLIAGIISLLAACEYIHNLTGDDEIVIQNQIIGTVEKLVIDAPCRIVLHNNNSEEVIIKGTSRLINGLDIQNNNATVTIKHDKKNFLQKSQLIEISISANHLNRLTANMAFELEAPETINTDAFVVVVNGGAKFAEIELDLNCNTVQLNVYGNNNIGNFYLSGTCNTCNFTLEGSVNINALSLKSTKAIVTHKSIGQCKVQPQSTLNVKSYSSGNTYYSGNPIVEHERISVPYLNSTGSVIKID